MPLLKKPSQNSDENIEKEVRYIMIQPTPWYMWVKTIFGFLVVLIILSITFSGAENIESGNSTYNKTYIESNFVAENTESDGYIEIGYLDLNGTILSKSSNTGLSISEGGIFQEDIVSVIRLFEEDDDIKAVVLRINSPGGAVGPSQIIGDYVKRLAAKKPVYVYSDELLASGGYWIAAPATKIYSYKSALVGSIGVISQIINAERLLNEKLGIDIKTYKAGKYKDVGSYDRGTNEEEDALLQDMVNSSYNDFITWVAENRGMKKDEVEKLATGWVFTGKQAVSNKLIDGNGLFEDFLSDMQSELGIKGTMQFVTYERPRSFIEELTASSPMLGVKTDLSILKNFEQSLTLPSGIYYLWR